MVRESATLYIPEPLLFWRSWVQKTRGIAERHNAFNKPGHAQIDSSAHPFLGTGRTQARIRKESGIELLFF